MANTLTSLIPDAYRALDTVSRELAGFIPSVTVDAGAARAAVGQNVRVPIAPAAAAEDIVAATNPPETGDQAFENINILIDKARAVPFRWTGEEQRGVDFGGPGADVLRAAQIAQAMRTLVNEIENDIAATYVSASRATGVAGTTPFATTLADSAQARKLLVDNGAPTADLQLVLDTTAGANMRTLATLNNANEAGTTTLREQGILLPLHGMSVRESAQTKTHAQGSVTGVVTVTANTAAGATAIGLSTAAGAAIAIKAGDVVTFAGDNNKYIAAADLTVAASSTGTLTIAKPGLRLAAAATTAVSVGAAFVANMAFHRNAIVLVQRAPAIPAEGDAADDRSVITDARTGISLELSIYRQYKRVRYEVGAAWGVRLIKPEHTAILLG